MRSPILSSIKNILDRLALLKLGNEFTYTGYEYDENGDIVLEDGEVTQTDYTITGYIEQIAPFHSSMTQLINTMLVSNSAIGVLYSGGNYNKEFDEKSGNVVWEGNVDTDDTVINTNQIKRSFYKHTAKFRVLVYLSKLSNEEDLLLGRQESGLEQYSIFEMLEHIKLLLTGFIPSHSATPLELLKITRETTLTDQYPNVLYSLDYQTTIYEKSQLAINQMDIQHLTITQYKQGNKIKIMPEQKPGITGVVSRYDTN